jgi:biopolymer transport protein ExbD
MFAKDRKAKRRVSLDISPLMDVAFQLIIFFAVTTTFLEQAGMQLELPESTTATAEETSPIEVSVTEDGTVRFQGQVVTVEQLESEVAALPATDRAKITVRADRHVEYGLIVSVIDALRKAGAEGLSLPMEAIEQGQGGGSSRGSRGPPDRP